MAKPRVTATDQLANVIEVVELGRRTGLLSIERGSGSVLEEGEIYFLNGRAIYASLAGLRGREALAALSRWGPCRFAFDRDIPAPVPNISAQMPAVYGGSSNSRSSDPNLARSQPGAFGSSPGAGIGRIPEGSGTWTFTPPPPGPAPMPPQVPPPTVYPAYSGSGPLSSGPLGPSPFGSSGVFSSSNAGGQSAWPTPAPNGMPGQGRAPAAALPATYLARRPRRAPDVRDLMHVVTSHNLSRSHRTILLLADGEHTVLDLARLSSKPVDEVTVLLDELEARGLIYYYS